MTDPADLQLKAEIDEIMKNVDDIMKKVKVVIPSAESKPQSSGE